jgi:hypothetical protein
MDDKFLPDRDCLVMDVNRKVTWSKLLLIRYFLMANPHLKKPTIFMDHDKLKLLLTKDWTNGGLNDKCKK